MITLFSKVIGNVELLQNFFEHTNMCLSTIILKDLTFFLW